MPYRYEYNPQTFTEMPVWYDDPAPQAAPNTQPTQPSEQPSWDIPTNVFSTSQSQSQTGLPDWGSAWAKDWLQNIKPMQAPNQPTAPAPTMGQVPQVSNNQSLLDALNALKGAPTLIEQTRKNMVDQYKSAMDQNLQSQLTPKISNLASRGVLSSSVAGDTLSNVLKDLQGKYSDQVTGANTWASNSLLDNLNKVFTASSDVSKSEQADYLAKQQAYKNLIDAYNAEQDAYKANILNYSSQGSMITNLLNAIRQSSASSTSQNPWEPYQTMLPFLFANRA